MAKWTAFISTFGARYDADLSYQVMTGFGQTVEWYLPTNASDTAAIQARGGKLTARLIGRWHRKQLLWLTTRKHSKMNRYEVAMLTWSIVTTVSTIARQTSAP